MPIRTRSPIEPPQYTPPEFPYFRPPVESEPTGPENVSHLQMELLGNADAVGVDTFAKGDAQGHIDEMGSVAIGYGLVEFASYASASDGGPVFAAAMTEASATGADFIFSWTTNANGTQNIDGTEIAVSVSRTYLIAIDIETWEPRHGPIHVAYETEHEITNLPASIDEGNFATFAADVLVEGEDTFVDMVLSTLAIEDQLSTVGAIIDFGFL